MASLHHYIIIINYMYLGNVYIIQIIDEGKLKLFHQYK